MIKKAEMTGVFRSNITLKNTILFKLIKIKGFLVIDLGVRLS